MSGGRTQDVMEVRQTSFCLSSMSRRILLDSVRSGASQASTAVFEAIGTGDTRKDLQSRQGRKSLYLVSRQKGAKGSYTLSEGKAARKVLEVAFSVDGLASWL